MQNFNLFYQNPSKLNTVMIFYFSYVHFLQNSIFVLIPQGAKTKQLYTMQSYLQLILYSTVL